MMLFTRYLLLFAVVTGLTINATVCLALEPAITGVVLLHGKGADPESLQPLGETLKTAGFSIEVPLLPWSGSANYSQPYQKAVKEIAGAISRLRAQGARRIVVAGHSLGGNAALRWATTDERLAAAVLLAPAHFPEGDTALKLAGESVTKAREILRAKSANQTSDFVEVPSGKTLLLPAAVYLS
ncbi:alpha/beta fold hydrolase [Candidatus Methylospira mobilis]|uniref:Alpha/beta fold hydrolase n=3 Tax=Candidatus Methylospira mobilis TaxID=1808979 RepID=A0A5Q0BFU1_9GAMM|nr:alpha/beta fold hydrolase [Candidatus Methylospira mobilis]QFY42723.1 alpha/beta fold hydrolase [Candidatus Methylospira mobilis]